MQARTIIPILLILFLAACSNAVDTADTPNLPEQNEILPSPTIAKPTATPNVILEEVMEATTPPVEVADNAPTPVPTEPFDPEKWQELPVIPTSLPPQTYQIYELGQQAGRNPQAFSKVGDCNAVTPAFLGEFDLRPQYIKLGDYSDMQTTLDYFAGSFGRESLAAKVGQSAHSVMSPLHNDWKVCEPNETPLDCEFRVQNPAFAIISLGANDAYGYVEFEDSLRRVIENTIGNGVVPILATKPDNTEGDHSINRTIATLANEYGLPLWNFWAVIQPLQDHGMVNGSAIHLSWSEQTSTADFETPGSLDYGWTMRNLSALQMLDAVREMVQQHELAQN